MIVASRYAKSLIDLAVETKQLEEVREDMKNIKMVCQSNPDFVLLLESPVVKTDKKMKIFAEIFKDKISNTTMAFLNMVAVKRREGYIDNIAYAFDEQYKTYKNITTVEVISATPLDADNKAQIMAIVAKSATGSIEIIEKTDKALIGGFVLNVNGQRIDTSVKRKLNDLRKNFSGNAYLPDLN